jgi:flagellar biosynthesis protein FlhA
LIASSTRPPGRPLARIKGVRRKFAQDVGFCRPGPHPDNLELRRPFGCRRGAVVGRARPSGDVLAINPTGVDAADRHETTDPAFGLPAVWIEGSAEPQMAGLRSLLDRHATIFHAMQFTPSCWAESNPALVEHMMKLARS